VQFRLYSSVLRNYPNQWMTAEDYKKLLYWNAWAQYVGGNTQWPDANEFWADWNAGTTTIDYRSWIHHNILGSSNWTVIEDVMGLRPRNDNQVELCPINIGWPNFAANNLRYRNADLSVVWDDPADGVVKYSGIPQGYSIFINGTRVATVDRLVQVIWNPDTGTVTLRRAARSPSVQRVRGTAVADPGDAEQRQMVDMFNKAGVDLTADLPNYAQGVATTASYTASGTAGANAVDGFPINEPIWGTYGIAERDRLPRAQPRPAAHGRRGAALVPQRPGHQPVPAAVVVPGPVLNGSAWTNAVASSVKTTGHPAGQLQRGAVRRGRHHNGCGCRSPTPPGSRPGSPRSQVYNRGGGDPARPRQQGRQRHPVGVVHLAVGVVAALNDGIDPPSSNDTVNPRWGTWPNTGEQWGLLTWPTAQSLDSADVYFFDDNGGVRLPASWKLQYWNGTAYVDAAASGYPTRSTVQPGHVHAR
jgi:hypothetical protein